MGSKQNGGEHAASIADSAYFRFVYENLYRSMVSSADRFGSMNGIAVEVGAAGGFLKKVAPLVITSDIRVAPSVDLLLDARSLPFSNESVSRIYLKDALHHIPDVHSFFKEAVRVLEPNGVIACADPYWGQLARLVYRYIHPEIFDAASPDWSFDSLDPMQSNQALLYILLRRDRLTFQKQFPALEILEIGPVIGPSYLLSGGVEGPFLLPQSWLIQMARLENRTSFWRRSLALGFITLFRKNP